MTGPAAVPEPTAMEAAVGLREFGIAFTRFGSDRKT